MSANDVEVTTWVEPRKQALTIDPETVEAKSSDVETRGLRLSAASVHKSTTNRRRPRLSFSEQRGAREAAGPRQRHSTSKGELKLIYLARVHIGALDTRSVDVESLYTARVAAKFEEFAAYVRTCAESSIMVAINLLGIDFVGFCGRLAVFDDGKSVTPTLMLGDGRIIDGSNIDFLHLNNDVRRAAAIK